jgi:hypothetical protein
MRYVKWPLLALIAAGTLLSCKTAHKTTKSATGTWQPQPITVDGANNDWPTPYPFYNDKAKIGYAVSNDKDNLYITMQTGDQMTIMKILRNGLTVWIDTNGKKEMRTSLTYPMENTNGSGMPMRGNGQEQPERPAAAEMQRKILESARDMSLVGFKSCNGGFLVQQNNGCGVVVRMGFDEYNTLVWEATVPFRAFYKNGLTPADAGRTVSICFAITGMKLPSFPGGQGGSGMPGGGGGMPGGGGMGGGGMPGGGGEMPGGGMPGGGMGGDPGHLFESTKTWYRTGLAYKAG